VPAAIRLSPFRLATGPGLQLPRQRVGQPPDVLLVAPAAALQREVRSGRGEHHQDAILTSFQATYRDQGLFEAGLQAALAEAATERPTIEAELAGIQKQLRETTAQRDELSVHQVDLTTQLHAVTPAVPQADSTIGLQGLY